MSLRVCVSARRGNLLDVTLGEKSVVQVVVLEDQIPQDPQVEDQA